MPVRHARLLPEILISGSYARSVTSGNTDKPRLQLVKSTSGNTEPGGELADASAAAAATLVDAWVAGTLDTLVDYSTALDGSPLSSSTRAKYRQKIAAYLDWLVDQARTGRLRGDPLTQASPRDWAVRDYRRHLKVDRKAAPATINLTLACLDDFYTRLGLGPAVIRREEPPARTAPKALDERAQRAYLRSVEQLDSTRDRVIRLLPYFAGLRIAEVVGLDLDDVALSARKGQLRVLGKGRDDGKVRTIPIHPQLRTALQSWLEDRSAWPGAQATPALLINRRSGARLSDRAARTIITTAGDSARITPPFGPHVLRHTFATRQLRKGVDIATVAELLGHGRLDTTLIYTRPTDADRVAAIATLLTDE